MKNSIIPQENLIFWQSSEWKCRSGREVPFNGIQIVVCPYYDVCGRLRSVGVRLNDFTWSRGGVSIAGEMSSSNKCWRLEANGHFTVEGVLELKMLDAVFDGVVLHSQRLLYGPPSRRRQVAGGLLAIELQGPPSRQDADRFVPCAPTALDEGQVSRYHVT